MKHANISLFVPHAGCPHQCSFCNQKTISGKNAELTPENVRKILSEAQFHGNNPQNTEIAFFGGSFTAIPRDYMLSLLEEAKPFIQKGIFSGIRISTRPDAIDGEVLDILKAYSVTAIELGAQSTDSQVLSLNRRGHSFEDIKNASRLIKERGFSLGLQMMTGLLGDTKEKSLKTARDIIFLKPDTVRIYPTIILEGTYLGELYKKGEFDTFSLPETVELCAELLGMFNEHGIKVIRLGLHSGGNVEDGYLSGPYHPAFGELCESKIYLENARKILNVDYAANSSVDEGGCEYTLFVNSREISKMNGQRGENKKILLNEGYKFAVKGDDSLKKYEISVKKRSI